ncbi:MAG: hypothetical protein JOY59_02890 [Candidatus Eremiobacteraeota bacterium]|nr:hypothetical protein [Candidatus Eremiobacteraeota bacterium]
MTLREKLALFAAAILSAALAGILSTTLLFGSKAVAAESSTADLLKHVIVDPAGNVTIKGANVSIQAAAQATVDGGATATLKSGASTVIKGAMVQIN